MSMLEVYSDDRPSPVVGALGGLIVLLLIAAIVLVFTRGDEDDLLPTAVGGGPGKIVFASNQEDDLDIYVINPDGSGRKQLTDSRSLESYPSWSPDGSKIVFESDRDGNT